MSNRSYINLNAYATEGQNVGTGTGVFAGKSSASTLDFKSLNVLGGLSISGDSTTITISGGSGGGASTWGSITGTLADQTDLNNALTGITSDLSTVSGQTDTNTSDITTLSGKTIDNLNSGILEYDSIGETSKPYSAYTEGSFYYGSSAAQPTGTTDLNYDGILTVSEIHLSTGLTATSHDVGDIYWDNEDNTIAITQSSDVTLQVGQESYVYVKNNTGSGINNGSVVFINGADSDRPTVALARADSSDGPALIGAIIGLATEDIPAGQTGYVTSFGLVKGLDTSGFVGDAGTTLYVSTTISGNTQEVKPSPPDYVIKVGIITKKDGIDGRILVAVTDETDLTGNTYTASNGITETSNNFKLGGSLSETTTISTVGYDYSVFGTCCNLLATYDGSIISRVFSNSGHTAVMDVTNTVAGECKSLRMNIDENNGILINDSVDTIGLQYGGDYSTNGSSNPRWLPDNEYVTGKTAGAASYLPKYNTAGDGITASSLFETGTTFGITATPVCGIATCNVAGIHAMVFQDDNKKLAFLYSTGSFSGPKIAAESTDSLRLSGGYGVFTFNNYIKINTSGSANDQMKIDNCSSYNGKELTYVGGDGYDTNEYGFSAGLIGGDARSGFNQDGGDVVLKAGAGDGTGSTGQILMDGPTCACDIFYPRQYNCVDVSCSGLPAPSATTGGMIYVADAVLMAWSDGTDWINFSTDNPI